MIYYTCQAAGCNAAVGLTVKASGSLRQKHTEQEKPFSEVTLVTNN